MRLSLTLALLSALLLAAACDRGEQKPAPGTGAEKSAPVNNRMLEPIPAATANNQGGGELSIRLIPEPLTSADGAEVMVSNCRQERRFAWEVNGQEVPAATGPRLERDYYQRDDEVAVRVDCGPARASVSTRVVNAAPVISRLGFQDPVIIAGKELVIVPETSDVDGDPVEVEYQWRVDGEELPWVTGPVLPAEYLKRDARITVTAIPSDGRDQGEPFVGGNLVVPNGPPHFTSTPPAVVPDTGFRYQAEATDPDNDPLTYRLEEAPPGMQVDEKTGLIAWAFPPGTAGSWTIRVVATDPDGMQARQEFSLTLAKQE
ncbi:hypothetical protein JCM30471_01480 [Desulfuromonas carbonis]|uniref:putative Ig domain-containing protein n=1 Tax=Desulfuromonas sp. DDH964 TaxID=1823759 RepID=UPI00078B699E|nr:putative Ig domain-containing protein [Desulfuromonas sp. DDH964]AMV71793.1 dystroglycan-type cadherin-like protein [Desulfuromonas sp. DDH964]